MTEVPCSWRQHVLSKSALHHDPKTSVEQPFGRCRYATLAGSSCQPTGCICVLIVRDSLPCLPHQKQLSPRASRMPMPFWISETDFRCWQKFLAFYRPRSFSSSAFKRSPHVRAVFCIEIILTLPSCGLPCLPSELFPSSFPIRSFVCISRLSQASPLPASQWINTGFVRSVCLLSLQNNLDVSDVRRRNYFALFATARNILFDEDNWTAVVTWQPGLLFVLKPTKSFRIIDF